MLYRHLLSGTCRDSLGSRSGFLPPLSPSLPETPEFLRLLLSRVSQSLPKIRFPRLCVLDFILFFSNILLLLWLLWLLWLLSLSGNPTAAHGRKGSSGTSFFLNHVTFLGFHRGERIPPCGDEGATHANIVNNLLPRRAKRTRRGPRSEAAADISPANAVLLRRRAATPRVALVSMANVDFSSIVCAVWVDFLCICQSRELYCGFCGHHCQEGRVENRHFSFSLNCPFRTFSNRCYS